MLRSLKSTLSKSLTNCKGWRTNKRIVVIQSDDWGSIRMPNKETRDVFQNKGYDILSNPYCRYDTLANSDDLKKLFAVLLKHKDKHGNYAAITANTVVANPDFEAIKKSNFEVYSYKPFTSTLKEYYQEEDVFEIWKEGIAKNIFIPQYHGREHLNVPIWLAVLRNKSKVFIEAFDLGFWGLPKNTYNENIYNLQAAYASSKETDLAYYKTSIAEGLNLFESIFNFRSKTFIANNYTWSPQLDSTLEENGVSGFQSMKYQKIPAENESGIYLKSLHTGKINKLKQVYMVRNCVFEPSLMPVSYNSVQNCLKDIENSFFFKKPAIIVSHRLNFVGAIEPANRDRNLVMLDQLLAKILLKWPDVIFMTSDKLVDCINTKS